MSLTELGRGMIPARYAAVDAVDDDDSMRPKQSTMMSVLEPDDGGHSEKGSVFGMTFNTITNVIGGGVLNLPFAMHQASIAIGSFLCVFSSICSCFSVYTLVEACEHYRKFSMQEVWAFSCFPQASHSDILTACDRRRECLINNEEDLENDLFLDKQEINHKRRDWMITLMIFIIFCYNFGCLVLYGVVIGDSLPPVVQHFFHGHGLWIDKGTWLIAGGVVFFVLSCARKMDELKWSSILGFVTILYIIIMVVVRFFTFRADPSEMPSFNQDTSEVKYFDFNVGLANAMTSLGLAYCYHYNVPYYYKELHDRSPKKMMLTAVFSQPVTFISYLSTGVFGYLTFGAAVANKHSGGNIVNNFSDDDTAMNIGRFGLFFHFCCVYPILAVSCRRGIHHLLERYILKPRRERLRREALPKIPNIDDTIERAHASDPDRHHHIMKARLLETFEVKEDPTLPVIAAEAFGIVSLSIFCAWVAPGISIVVNVTGSLFGLLIMFVLPGIIGIQLFGLLKVQEEQTGDFVGARWKYGMSWMLVVVGSIMVVSSFYTIVAPNGG